MILSKNLILEAYNKDMKQRITEAASLVAGDKVQLSIDGKIYDVIKSSSNFNDVKRYDTNKLASKLNDEYTRNKESREWVAIKSPGASSTFVYVYGEDGVLKVPAEKELSMKEHVSKYNQIFSKYKNLIKEDETIAKKKLVKEDDEKTDAPKLTGDTDEEDVPPSDPSLDAVTDSSIDTSAPTEPAADDSMPPPPETSEPTETPVETPAETPAEPNQDEQPQVDAAPVSEEDINSTENLTQFTLDLAKNTFGEDKLDIDIINNIINNAVSKSTSEGIVDWPKAIRVVKLLF